MNNNNSLCFAVGQIGHTKNYSDFHAIDGNRKIVERKDLIRSMKTYGFDKNQRIQIWADGVIADGQHRLKTAEKLKLDVYFEVIEEPANETRIEYIQRINSASRNWKTTDFIHSKAVDDPVLAYFDALKAKYVDDKKNPNRVPFTVFQVCAGLTGKTSIHDINSLSSKILPQNEIESNIAYVKPLCSFIKNDAYIYLRGLLLIKRFNLISPKEEKSLFTWLKLHPGCLPCVNGNVQQAFIWLDQAFNSHRKNGQIGWSMKYLKALSMKDNK